MSANRTFRLLAAAGVTILAAPLASAMGSKPADDEGVEIRIAPVSRIVFAETPAGGAAAAGARTGEQLYKAVCQACHAAGVAGSPKFGDKAAWAPRIAKGLDALMNSATNGTAKGMPPKGGSDATPEELKRAVVYMANAGGASFKAP